MGAGGGKFPARRAAGEKRAGRNGSIDGTGERKRACAIGGKTVRSEATQNEAMQK
jgi:hypothetical protein